MILCSGVACRVLLGCITDFEESLRDPFILVRLQRLQQAGNERRAPFRTRWSSGSRG